MESLKPDDLTTEEWLDRLRLRHTAAEVGLDAPLSDKELMCLQMADNGFGCPSCRA